MIEEGKTDGWLHLSLEALKPWAQLNGIEPNNVHVSETSDKGAGVITTSAIPASHDTSDLTVLMTIPHDLILSKERVEQHVKVDKDFRAILQGLGEFGQSPRIHILTFLLTQCLVSHPSMAAESEPRFVHTPFTTYTRLLPLVPTLPTFYSITEQSLLRGTSLHPALQAKLLSLDREFTTFTSLLSSIPWFNNMFLTDLSPLPITSRDWFHLDAFYRSRALDMPHAIGHCMVPALDMANHASNASTTALYEISPPNNDAVLLLRPNKSLEAGEEVCITYGDAKGACEMLFSYGFLEHDRTTAGEIFLDLSALEDDPLAKAKRAVASTPPGFKIVDQGDDEGDVRWEGAYVWLLVVNEEDGLEFMIERTVDGDQELRTSWRGEMIDGAEALESKVREARDLWDVLQLRAISVLQDRVGEQLSELDGSEDEVAKLVEAGETSGVRRSVGEAVCMLRRLEGDLLRKAYAMLERQKEQLLQSEIVLAYLSGGNNVTDEELEQPVRISQEADGTDHDKEEDEDFS